MPSPFLYEQICCLDMDFWRIMLRDDHVVSRGALDAGLFLSKEILAIARISIKDTSETGKGARFDLMIPTDGFQFT